MSKTLDSQIKAVRKYENERDVIRAVLPKGTKERIKQTGYSINAFANEAISRMLDDIEGIRPVTEESAPVIDQEDKKPSLEELQAIIDERKRENNRVKGDKEEIRELGKLHAKREMGD